MKPKRIQSSQGYEFCYELPCHHCGKIVELHSPEKPDNLVSCGDCVIEYNLMEDES